MTGGRDARLGALERGRRGERRGRSAIEEEVMLARPETWLPVSRCEDVLRALPDDGRRTRAAETHGLGARAGDRRRTRPSATAIAQLADLRAGLADALERARAARGRGRARIRRRAGRTSRSRRAPATSTCTPRCASWRGASRRSRCTSTSRCPDAEAAVRALNGMRAHLPVLLALSAQLAVLAGPRQRARVRAHARSFQAFPRTGIAARGSTTTPTTSRRSTC